MDEMSPAPPAIGLAALFGKFLRFGCLAFGGPVAQIAMVREALVEEERWISQERFNRLFAVMQVLPGPEAHELCVHLGMIARGRVGGLLAGLGFMLPGFVLMMICGWAYDTLISGDENFAGLLLAVQAAVLAIILRSVWRIGEHILLNRVLFVAAAIGLVGTFFGVPFWIMLVGAAIGFAAFQLPWQALFLLALTTVTGWLTLELTIVKLPSFAQLGTGPATTAALFLAGLKGGLLTFGGAYTAIPYVRDDTVGRGWLSDGTFLDGVALAGLLPAPLVIFATFAGYVAGGWTGALAITFGMFLPAFAFSMIFYERLESIVADPQLQRMLEGVAATVVGIIAGTFFALARHLEESSSGPLAIAPIFVLALITAWRLKGTWVAPAIIAIAAMIGALFLD